MKNIIFLLASVIFLGTVSAQEPASLEDAQKGAKLVTKNAINDGPLKMEVDVQKPSAIRAGEFAVLVIPDKQVSAETLAKAGQEIQPLGQLWMLKLAPAQQGKVTPNAQLRLVTVTTDEQEYKLPLFFLGSRKNETGALELVVYAKNKEPLLRVPLGKAERTQQLPIELQARKTEEDSGVLTLHLVGKYKAELTLLKQEE